MKGYILKRIIYSLLVLYIIATLNFLILQVFSPRSPIDWYRGVPGWTQEMIDRQIRLFGLDRPLTERYLTYLVNMFTWNFGKGLMSKKPVVQEIAVRLPKSLLILATSMMLSILVGFLVGIFAASRRGSKLDVAAIGTGLFTFAAPTFFIQIMLLIIFNRILGWFPPGGMLPEGHAPTGLAFVVTVLHHMALPVASLVVTGFGARALYTRNMMLESLTQDYIVTARAKGLKERAVLFGHAFRSILPPIVTMVAMGLPALITGSVITEWVFGWPGIGAWYLNSLVSMDYPAAQAMLFVYAVLMIVANFIADMLYGFLDPRIKVGVRR